MNWTGEHWGGYTSSPTSPAAADDGPPSRWSSRSQCYLVIHQPFNQAPSTSGVNISSCMHGPPAPQPNYIQPQRKKIRQRNRRATRARFYLRLFTIIIFVYRWRVYGVVGKSKVIKGSHTTSTHRHTHKKNMMRQRNRRPTRARLYHFLYQLYNEECMRSYKTK